MANICFNKLTIWTDSPEGAAARSMLLNARAPNELLEGRLLLNFKAIRPEPFDLPDGPIFKDHLGREWPTTSDEQIEWGKEHWE